MFHADPCLQLPDGNYPLTSSFQGLFPFVDQRCNFVKCAHRTAFINQCGIGTRNPSTEGYDDQTDDRPLYCSETDSGGLCRSQVVAADVSVDEYGTPVEGSTPINEGELGESFSADGIGV